MLKCNKQLNMKNTLKKILVFSITAALFTACANEELTPYYSEQEAGKVVIRGYNASQDSIQINVNDKLLEIDKNSAFIKKIIKDYDFVYYTKTVKNIKIINKVTGEILHTYDFTVQTPIDTLSFYYKSGFWIDNVLSFKPSILSQSGLTCYKFIFPTLNRYSNSGYNGTLDGIIRKTNGQQLGIVENIGKTEFSTFLEFPFSAPPILKMELVKHGTTESYIPGQQVFVTMVMSSNKSRLVVLEEKADSGEKFSGVDGTIDLVDYFDF